MNEPSRLKKFFGSPDGVLLVWLGVASVAYRCWSAQLSYFWLMVALVIGVQAFAALRDVRRYNQWRKQWDSIGQNRPVQAKTESRIKFLAGWSLSERLQLALFVCAAVLLLVENLGIFDFGNSLHWSAVIYIGGFLIANGIKALKNRTGLKFPFSRRGSLAKESATDGPPPVSWAINPASSAESRAFAESNLPEYAARVLTENSEPPNLTA